jgi:hypothetical protein
VPLVQGKSTLRSQGWNSRFNPSMLALMQEFKSSGVTVWLFGLGSDASVVKGSVASVWSRVYTDYGVIGLLLLGAGLGAIAIHSLRWTKCDPASALFLLLFFLSIYQRPVVWMPYALLLLLCGPINAAAVAYRPKLNPPKWTSALAARAA